MKKFKKVSLILAFLSFATFKISALPNNIITPENQSAPHVRQLNDNEIKILKENLAQCIHLICFLEDLFATELNIKLQSICNMPENFYINIPYLNDLYITLVQHLNNFRKKIGESKYCYIKSEVSKFYKIISYFTELNMKIPDSIYKDVKEKYFERYFKDLRIKHIENFFTTIETIASKNKIEYTPFNRQLDRFTKDDKINNLAMITTIIEKMKNLATLKKNEKRKSAILQDIATINSAMPNYNRCVTELCKINEPEQNQKNIGSDLNSQLKEAQKNLKNILEKYKLSKIEENKIEENKIEENKIEENKIETNTIEEKNDPIDCTILKIEERKPLYPNNTQEKTQEQDTRAEDFIQSLLPCLDKKIIDNQKAYNILNKKDPNNMTISKKNKVELSSHGPIEKLVYYLRIYHRVLYRLNKKSNENKEEIKNVNNNIETPLKDNIIMEESADAPPIAVENQNDQYMNNKQKIGENKNKKTEIEQDLEKLREKIIFYCDMGTAQTMKKSSKENFLEDNKNRINNTLLYYKKVCPSLKKCLEYLIDTYKSNLNQIQEINKETDQLNIDQNKNLDNLSEEYTVADFQRISRYNDKMRERFLLNLEEKKNNLIGITDIKHDSKDSISTKIREALAPNKKYTLEEISDTAEVIRNESIISLLENVKKYVKDNKKLGDNEQQLIKKYFYSTKNLNEQIFKIEKNSKRMENGRNQKLENIFEKNNKNSLSYEDWTDLQNILGHFICRSISDAFFIWIFDNKNASSYGVKPYSFICRRNYSSVFLFDKTKEERKKEYELKLKKTIENMYKKYTSLINKFFQRRGKEFIPSEKKENLNTTSLENIDIDQFYEIVIEQFEKILGNIKDLVKEKTMEDKKEMKYFAKTFVNSVMLDVLKKRDPNETKKNFVNIMAQNFVTRNNILWENIQLYFPEYFEKDKTENKNEIKKDNFDEFMKGVHNLITDRLDRIIDIIKELKNDWDDTIPQNYHDENGDVIKICYEQKNDEANQKEMEEKAFIKSVIQSFKTSKNYPPIEDKNFKKPEKTDNVKNSDVQNTDKHYTDVLDVLSEAAALFIYEKEKKC